jgi:hypothetical protein
MYFTAAVVAAALTLLLQRVVNSLTLRSIGVGVLATAAVVASVLGAAGGGNYFVLAGVQIAAIAAVWVLEEIRRARARQHE